MIPYWKFEKFKVSNLNKMQDFMFYGVATYLPIRDIISLLSVTRNYESECFWKELLWRDFQLVGEFPKKIYINEYKMKYLLKHSYEEISKFVELPEYKYIGLQEEIWKRLLKRDSLTYTCDPEKFARFFDIQGENILFQCIIFHRIMDDTAFYKNWQTTYQVHEICNMATMIEKYYNVKIDPKKLSAQLYESFLKDRNYQNIDVNHLNYD